MSTGATVSTEPVATRIWERFTPQQRMGRFATYLVVVAAVVWSFRQIEIIPEFLYDAPQQSWDLFQRMWPIDWAYYPKGVHDALIETFHIATLGTLLALILGFPIALMAAKNITKSTTLNWIAQFLLVASRSVNSLIWAPWTNRGAGLHRGAAAFSAFKGLLAAGGAKLLVSRLVPLGYQHPRKRDPGSGGRGRYRRGAR
jgi:ABC-type phosphate/phosphonate transport system permease subunit